MLVFINSLISITLFFIGYKMGELKSQKKANKKKKKENEHCKNISERLGNVGVEFEEELKEHLNKHPECYIGNKLMIVRAEIDEVLREL